MDSVISNSLTVCFCSFILKIIIVNQIAWFFNNRKYLQSSFIIWFHFMYESLASWFKSTEFCVPYSQAFLSSFFMSCWATVELLNILQQTTNLLIFSWGIIQFSEKFSLKMLETWYAIKGVKLIFLIILFFLKKMYLITYVQ